MLMLDADVEVGWGCWVVRIEQNVHIEPASPMKHPMLMLIVILY